MIIICHGKVYLTFLFLRYNIDVWCFCHKIIFKK